MRKVVTLMASFVVIALIATLVSAASEPKDVTEPITESPAAHADHPPAPPYPPRAITPRVRRRAWAEPRVRAVATKALVSPPGKRSFLRVQLEVKKGAYVVTPVSGPGSHLLAGLSRANALAVVPEDVEKVPAGEPVDVLVLERRGR